MYGMRSPHHPKISPYNSQEGSSHYPTPNGYGLNKGMAVPRPLYSPNYHRPVDPLDETGAERASETAGDHSGSPSKGIARLFQKFAERCSLNGVPFIQESKNWKVKTLWSVLLALAIGAMTYHLCRLFDTFYDFNKSSKLSLTFSDLQFPAITVCNVNAVRMSQISSTSDSMQEFVAAVHPDRLKERIQSYEPEYESIDTDSYYNEDWDNSDTESTTGRRKRQTQSNNTANIRNGNFLDDAPLTANLTGAAREDVDDDFYTENFSDSWEAESQVSQVYELEQTFISLLSEQTQRTRAQIGHQLPDMLLQCSFSGRKCVQSNFTRLLTSGYGNCFTLEYSKFISRKSGPAQGLELVFYLETDEYIPGVTTGKGMQLVIHDQKTMAFPDDEGVAIPSGTETNIGLRQLQIKRLGKPHGHCSDSDDFQTQYGVKYTRTTCQKICEQNGVRTTCECFDQTAQEINRLMTIPTTLKPCKSNKEISCMRRVSLRFQDKAPDCNCDSPCSETIYEKTLSSRTWPNDPYASLLAASICKGNPDTCSSLNEKDSNKRLRHDFVKLNIFYESLNYELLEEQADYAVEQFVSDVGGVLGLWIGLSILSVCELIQLFANIIVYVVSGKWRKSKSQNKARSEDSDPSMVMRNMDRHPPRYDYVDPAKDYPGSY